jgi:hypothetical protein
LSLPGRAIRITRDRGGNRDDPDRALLLRDLTITIAGAPLMSALCHCDSCKRRTGSAFGWSVYVRDDDVVETTGGALVYAVPVTPPAARSFCARCGTTLFWKVDVFPGLTGIAAGCFADAPPPTISASSGQRCAWLDPPAGCLQT